MENQGQSSITLSEKAQSELTDTARWIKYLIILVIVSFITSLIFSFMPNGNKIQEIFMQVFHTTAPEPNPAKTIASLLIAVVLYIFPVYCLIQFSTSVKLGYEKKLAKEFESAFSYYKQMVQYLGILIIICFALFILFIIGLVLFIVVAGVTH